MLKDLKTMPDYLHYNPGNMAMLIKSWIARISTFRHHVQRGLYPENQGMGVIDIRIGEPD